MNWNRIGLTLREIYQGKVSSKEKLLTPENTKLPPGGIFCHHLRLSEGLRGREAGGGEVSPPAGCGRQLEEGGHRVVWPPPLS